jgi:hypothetical protein
MPSTTTAAAETAIWSRIIAPEGDGLPRAAARALLRLTFSDRDKDRMSDLARKGNEGRLSAAERRELEGYVKVGDVLSLIHLKARKSLRP